MSGKNIPEKISEKEYNIARMMSKLGPEERLRLSNLYKQERLMKLQNLKEMSEMPLLDETFVDEDTIKYLAHDKKQDDEMH